MKNQAILRIWCGCFLLMTVTIAGCIHWIDYPLAATFLKSLKQGAAVGGLLGGRNIMAAEILVIMALTFAHIWNGDLPKPAKTLLVACSASVMAYTLNSSVLKVIFGRSNPAAFYHGHAGKFNLFRGDELSSFPSGHMMLASAFLAVGFYVYSRARTATLLLLLLGCLLLVMGDWHYVSDVLAGTFVGFTMGLMTAELFKPA